MVEQTTFGGWAIDRALYDHILELIPEGSTIIELGSGGTSRLLADKYNLWSVEHDEKWVGQYHDNYIHAPLVPYSDKVYPRCSGWYDLEVLKRKLPKEYDAIIVDGPIGGRGHLTGRGGFDTHFDLFRIDVPIFFDDVHRDDENLIMRRVAKKLGLKSHTVVHVGMKMYSVIIPKESKIK